MTKNTSISLGPHFDTFIQNQIETGRYASTSEVARAGLRLLEKEEEKLKLLRQALVDGEQSGWADDFDPEEFRARMRGKRKS
ncbi:type II toxin-antitoxin system ParD family antitoxin [Dyadobacter fermentans]|uniref:Putative addiction module antidote protein, CopG/Arc/MetJ family n=1 Tax=Dyadobacter fermentans (strain ATCC 700827 / DSM 18053 / CIP 107007 / KCTC 52180 / NS114) TaxID=471854 RepID=C6W6Z8_DYAFD|nr:type II toxin-antitoxin system ParD family antitoxin [Dyadobacter fermentans]ACT92607.1 putative addiction module antidote protein, CopG/Arc/MetJ family [Dyadobacter fermentans DSM 18053]